MKKSNLLYLVFAVGLTQATQGFCDNLQSLLPDERNTVDVFQKASPKVVFVSRLTTVRNRLLHQNKDVKDGAGTGIIWNDKGYVVTNFHVIQDADKLEITLNKMTVPALVVGKEPRMDLAVLKVNSPKALAYLKTYKPFNRVRLQDIRVGQKAIAIGNPFGLDHSMSRGVISALGRDVPGIGGVSIPNMIQTDTSINPGNSGGPLLNSGGELLGINTTIYSQSGTSVGIGFAIPAEEVNLIVSQIIAKGHVSLPGIGIHQVRPKDANKYGVKEGILIADVLANSPAAKSKLHGMSRDSRGRRVRGDVIVALNSKRVADYDDYYHLLQKVKVGEQVNLSILRGNKKMNVSLKTIDLAALPLPRGYKAGFYHTSYA